jgi:hypothetical protein
VADVCNGKEVPTAFTLVVDVEEVGVAADDTLTATRLAVGFSMGTDDAPGCTATNRKVDFEAELV